MNHNQKMMVQYVSNAGLLLTDGKNAILVDPFTNDPDGIYEETSASMRQELLVNIKNNWIDLLIITHEHPDHFCAADVDAAMALHSKMHLITTKAAADQLAGRNAYIQEGRLTVMDGNLRTENRIAKTAGDQLMEEEPAVYQAGDFRVELLHVTHEGDQYAGVDNLAVWIEWNMSTPQIEQKCILITGDAQPGKSFAEIVCRKGMKKGRGLDWLFAPFPYAGTLRGRKWMETAGEIANVFALHFPAKEKDVQHWRENTVQFCKSRQDMHAKLVIPEQTGGWYRLF